MKKNYAYAIVSVLIWATMAAAVKLLLASIPNLQALAVSSALAFVFLLLLNLKSGAWREMKKYRVKDFAIIAGLGFLGLFLYSALYYYGIGELSSQEACILNYLWPMMLMIFSTVILKERLTAIKIVAMLCSFLGIVILSTGGGSDAAGNVMLGMISCIAAAVAYGLFSVLNKKADYNQNIAMMLMWLVTAVAATLLGVFTEDWQPILGVQWLGMLWLGVVVSAVAYLLWALALKGGENTAKIANLAYLTPFLSLLVSAVLLGEQIRPRAIIALIFIIGGILLQSLYEQFGRKAKKSQ